MRAEVGDASSGENIRGEEESGATLSFNPGVTKSAEYRGLPVISCDRLVVELKVSNTGTST